MGRRDCRCCDGRDSHRGKARGEEKGRGRVQAGSEEDEGGNVNEGRVEGQIDLRQTAFILNVGIYDFHLER